VEGVSVGEMYFSPHLHSMFYFHVSDIPVCLHNTCCEYPRHLCHMWLEKAENLRHIWDSFDQQIIPFAPEWPVPPAAG